MLSCLLVELAMLLVAAPVFVVFVVVLVGCAGCGLDGVVFFIGIGDVTGGGLILSLYPSSWLSLLKLVTVLALNRAVYLRGARVVFIRCFVLHVLYYHFYPYMSVSRCR